MIQVEREDLLRALKGFKGIAKQDLLLPDQTPQTQYRKTHAEARREIYAKLIDLVEEGGITEACVFTLSEYKKIPDVKVDDPALNGRTQALELFFNLIGVTPDKLSALKKPDVGIEKFWELLPQVQNSLYVQN